MPNALPTPSSHPFGGDHFERVARLALALADAMPKGGAAELAARLWVSPMRWGALLEAASAFALGLHGVEQAELERALVAGLREALGGDSELERFARLRRLGVPVAVLREHFAPAPTFERVEIPA